MIFSQGQHILRRRKRELRALTRKPVEEDGRSSPGLWRENRQELEDVLSDIFIHRDPGGYTYIYGASGA